MKALRYKGLCRRALLLVAVMVAMGGLPLLGLWLARRPVRPCLAFPPLTQFVEHAPFAWPLFGILALLALLTGGAIVLSLLCARPVERERTPSRFPLWGWGGLILTGLAWGLAWSRMAWFAPFQVTIFTPLWLGYIVVINGLMVRRTGRCLMTTRPGLFLGLFPMSALFWWFFEYLNRFAQNWYYPPILELGPLAYFLMATLPFATVLPAVLSTADLLGSLPRLDDGALHGPALRLRHPRRAAVVLLVFAAMGLVGLGVWPNLLFPLLWLSPLVLVLGLAVLCGQTTVLSPVSWGDWTLPVRFALAALICGFFWEFWNIRSAAQWVYSVPYVHRFLIFEMPLLGYLGYLPFGLECVAIVDFLLGGRFGQGEAPLA
ncbi:MAG: hypothetical protein HN919_02640 [Verrucomicrobia bacterium]|jgi:hypothetical protein|nr:hypothetical protein [Verrucomicrobiota bacterium]MBT7065173.1 hypothetical protein [Verrucomicrobiota bacterium]MBT7699382.1 hypothetical protein [Verrucomicrobiota bacterium]